MSINKSEILALSIVFFTPIAVTAQVATSAPGASFVESLSASIKAKTNPPAPTPADAVAPQTSPPQAQAQPVSPNANKTPEKPVPAAPSAPSAGTPSEKRPVVSNELVTIESLADAQRRALLAKEADLKREASKPTVGAAPVTPPPSVKHMNLPAPKTRHLHAIYTNQRGELVAEIIHNRILRVVRDGQMFDGLKIEFAGSNSLSVHGLQDTNCKKKPCETVTQTIRVGNSF